MIAVKTVRAFQAEVWQYYDVHGRHDLPWRLPDQTGWFDPYKLMVSELMLQQTQVNRVLPKYVTFITQFPTLQSLAVAPLADVLVAWQGLGYNRRAKFLWQAAQMVAHELDNQFPITQKELTRLPGVGMNTAGAIMTYAYNKPVVFIETNIRTVFIHHFFNDQTAIADKAIEAVVAQCLPSDNAREWYWALMDYGTHIKQTHGNRSQASRSYVKQSPFHGSRRQVRGAIIRYLSQRPATITELAVAEADPRLTEVMADLVREGLVKDSGGQYSLG